MRLGGWQRIGIVLSVIWALGAVWHVRSQEVQVAQNLLTLDHRICDEELKHQRGFDYQGCMRKLARILVGILGIAR
jgi:hypothetical protein